MSKITDYSFLFQSMFGTKSNAGVVNPLRVSDLSNGSLRPQLKAAGIDTNSAQYKAAVKEMTKHIIEVKFNPYNKFLIFLQIIRIN